jgi:hypothetical protein
VAPALAFAIEALSPHSVLSRFTPFRWLVHRRSFFNPFWVSEYELVSPFRPKACHDALEEVLPGLWAWSPFSRFNVGGDVWPDGFAVFRLYPWRAGATPHATGTFVADGPVTRIHVDIGISKVTAAFFLLWLLLWIAAGVAVAVAMLSAGRLPPFWIVMGLVVVILVPFLTAHHSPKDDRYFIDFLAATIGTEERASTS